MSRFFCLVSNIFVFLERARVITDRKFQRQDSAKNSGSTKWNSLYISIDHAALVHSLLLLCYMLLAKYTTIYSFYYPQIFVFFKPCKCLLLYICKISLGCVYLGVELIDNGVLSSFPSVASHIVFQSGWTNLHSYTRIWVVIAL